jgi:hypothetical protein
MYEWDRRIRGAQEAVEKRGLSRWLCPRMLEVDAVCSGTVLGLKALSSSTPTDNGTTLALHTNFSSRTRDEPDEHTRTLVITFAAGDSSIYLAFALRSPIAIGFSPVGDSDSRRIFAAYSKTQWPQSGIDDNHDLTPYTHRREEDCDVTNQWPPFARPGRLHRHQYDLCTCLHLRRR